MFQKLLKEELLQVSRPRSCGQKQAFSSGMERQESKRMELGVKMLGDSGSWPG